MVKDFERLKKYLVDVSTEYIKDETSVHADYVILYEDRRVHGTFQGKLYVDDLYGSMHAEDYIDWSKVAVFKRLKRW